MTVHQRSSMHDSAPLINSVLLINLEPLINLVNCPTMQITDARTPVTEVILNDLSH